MKQTFERIWFVTRAQDWRLSLVPFVVGCIYLWIGWLNVKLTVASLQLFILSVVTTIGFSALGYFINEFFDKKTDAEAGKINTLSKLPGVYQLLLFLVCVATALLPWLGLPADTLSCELILLEIALFFLYSLPFPRFKKIVVVSSITDAGYAYVVPILLTFHTFSLFTTQIENEVLLFLIPAVLVIGFRNITIHHINDIFKDQRSNTVTLPQKIGVRNTNHLLAILLAIECILMLLWSINVAVYQPLFWAWVLIYVVFIVWRFNILLPEFKVELLSIHPLRHITDPAYQYMFPAFNLIYVLLVDYKWLWLVPFHLFILVPKPFTQKAIGVIRSTSVALWYVLLRRIRSYIIVPISALINYLIYFLFLVIGVNLRKEKISALSFIKKKLSRQ
jgi:1,4-dihydroxy-2-naphthoate octaprenyltransferase